MLTVVLLVLGSTAITLQETAASPERVQFDANAFAPADPAATEDALSAFPTTLNVPEAVLVELEPRGPKSADEGSSCKNQFLCNLRKKSSLSKDFPPTPSKNLVPPFTDSEEEEEGTAVSKAAETESPLRATSFSGTAGIRTIKSSGNLRKRNYAVGLEKAVFDKPAASNERRSYRAPEKLTQFASQVDRSYLPPQGALPAAASLDSAAASYLPPGEVSPAAAQTDVSVLKPEGSGRNVCMDSFHSFLCTPLRSRKRITGARPNSLVPERQAPSSFNPAASNTVQNTVGRVRPTSPSTAPPARPTTQQTTPRYSPLPSNVDRSYLPPSSAPVPAPAPKFAASPSFNSVKIVNELPTTTTRRPFSTSTARPFDHTSIIPYLSPKVMEHLSSLATSTTIRTTTTAKPKTTTPAVARLFPEPSNDVNRGYLPPATTKRPIPIALPSPSFPRKQKSNALQIIQEEPKKTTTTIGPRFNPAPTNVDNSYLPPSQKFESAAAAQVNQAISAPSPVPAPATHREEHDHDHHHHHGRDLCTDPFHSFLCAPLKQRRRITGALPAGFNQQSSNQRESRVKPDAGTRPENTFQSETRIKPSTDRVPAPTRVSAQSAGYTYPKPTPGFPLPSQTSTERVRPETLRPSTGYLYPKPANPFPLPSQQNVEIIPKENRVSSTAIPPKGYQYPKPAIPFPLPSEPRPSTTLRPFSPAPSSTPASGYSYPKPEKPFPLPSRQENVIATSPKPLQPQPSDQRPGYQYPKPDASLPLPGGYKYPKPAQPLLLPTEIKSSSSTASPAKSNFRPSLRDLPAVEFIPVNKIDSKRQAPTETAGTVKFGERIRSRARHNGPARTF